MTQSNPENPAQQEISGLIRRMREDWNGRAIDDARYYVAFGQRKQRDEDFNATAAEAVARIRRDFQWLARDVSVRSRRFLEIGCGPGRLMRNLASDCGEIHGVDISDEMIRLGREWLSAIPHAHLHVATENDLRAFANGSFDVVYSYAVIQHFPDRIPFWRYLQEAFRVLKTGGVLTIQFNEMTHKNASPDTWAGITVPAKEVVAACRAAGMHIRSLEGENTQYVWITAQKATGGPAPMQRLVDIDGVVGANNLQGTVIAGGPDGYISLFIRELPDEFCDVTDLTVLIGGSTAPAFYVGCADGNGQRQINAWVSDGTPVGAMPLQLLWQSRVISSSYSVLVNSPSAPSSRILVVTDGHEVGRHNIVYCGWAKVWITDLLTTESLTATVGGIPVSELDFFCEDVRARRYQINLRIPDQVPAGVTDLVLLVADAALPAVRLEIVRG
jgi:SAM-dependent methyltransferase